MSKGMLKDKEFIFAVYGLDPLAIPITYRFAQWKISPNAVTIATIICGFLAGGAFLQASYKYYLVGALCFYLAMLLDCVDGKLARLTGKTSNFGRLLDFYGDKTRTLASALGLTFGLQLKGFTYGYLVFLFYISLPAIRAILNSRNTFIKDPSIAFYDKHKVPDSLRRNRVGYIYMGWEKSALCFILGPILNQPILIMILAVFIEIIIYLFGLIILIKSDNSLQRAG